MFAESFSPVLFRVSLFCAVVGETSLIHQALLYQPTRCICCLCVSFYHLVFIAIYLGSLLVSFFRCSYDGMQASSGRGAAENRGLRVPQ